MATDYELTLNDYLAILNRRVPYIVGIFVIASAIAVIVAFSIPSTYRATGTITADVPVVPDSLVPNPTKDNLDERINIIQQRVMTRESLSRIIDKYDLFKNSPPSRTRADMVDLMRKRITVEPATSDANSSQQGLPTVAFSVSYDDRKPEVALQISKELVQLFLDWNAKLRTEGATDTATFLGQESSRLKADLDRQESKISAFKSRNSANLPEQVALRQSMVARAENDLYEVERDIRSGTEELSSLEAELDANKNGLSDDPSQTLPALKAQYKKLSATYTESYPDVRALKRKIEALEQTKGGGDATSASPTDVTNLAAYKTQAKINALNARLESLTQQKQMLQDKIAQNENSMQQTPRVAQELEVLVRDRDAAQKKYDELHDKKVNAQIVQNLEESNKSEQFTLLEPPILPEKPYKPDRLKILILGLLLAGGASLGSVFALESINKKILGSEALTHVLGCRPLVVIPFIATLEDEARKKLMIKRAAIGTGVTFVVTSIAVLFIHYL